MAAQPYDFVAIGTGPVGESAAELAALNRHRSVVTEKNRPGGTVTTSGGAPTKTLREAALYLSGFRDGDIYSLRFAMAPDRLSDSRRRRSGRKCKPGPRAERNPGGVSIGVS
jgi:NAD(P) transhydrogenase